MINDPWYKDKFLLELIGAGVASVVGIGALYFIITAVAR